MQPSINFLEKIDEFYKKISKAQTLYEATDIALKLVLDIFSSDIGVLGFWSFAENKMVFIRYKGISFVPPEIVYGKGLIGESLSEGKLIVTRDYSSEPYAIDELKEEISSAMAVPLGVFGQDKEGVIGVARGKNKPGYTDTEVLAFSVISKIIAGVLWSYEFFELLEKSERTKRIVTQSIKKMLSEVEELNIINVILKEMLSIFDAQFAAFHRWDKQKKMLIPILTQGFDFQLPPCLPGEGVAGKAFESKKAYIARYYPRELDINRDRIANLMKDKVSSAISIPVRVKGEVVGTISVGRGKYKPPFNMEDLDTLILMGSIVEAVIDNARMREKEREQMERISRVQRLEAIGTLAGGIAHDFNNILNAINGLAELAITEVSNPESVKKYLQVILEQTKHGANLVRQILDFARKGPSDKRPVDLKVFIKEFVKLIRRTFPSPISVQFQIEEGDYLVFADPSQIQQMLMNICINARDAMPQGGELIIRLYNEKVEGHEALRDGEYVVIEIKDTGHGMDEYVLDKALEPFFTTKPEGKGTGLGLPQAYGIAKQHGGIILIDSKVGVGTRVRIFIPKAEIGLVDYEMSRKKSEYLPRGKGERILVVEDDEMSLMICKKMLEILGYEVITARNGEEALKIYEEKNPHLVVADVVMPKMGGKELLSKIKEIDPEAKVILISGYSMEKEASSYKSLGALGYLQKPFTYQELAEIVHKALAKII